MTVADEFEFTILCYKCMEEVPDLDQGEFFWAEFGYRPSEGHKILACVPWTFRAPYSKSERFLCDGCGTGIAVAPSSNWFVEKHKAERAVG